MAMPNVEMPRLELPRKGLTDLQCNLNGLAIIVLGVAAVFLNSRLFGRLYKKKKFDSLIVNLILSSLGLCILSYPLVGYSSFMHTWAFGDKGCQAYGIMALFFGFAMMNTIGMIAINEYLSFSWPGYSDYESIVKKLMLAYTWINTTILSLAPTYGWSRISYEPMGTSCSVIYRPNEGYTSYILTAFFTCYVLPVLMLLICKLRYNVKSKFTRVLSQRTTYLLLSFVGSWSLYSIVYLWPILTTKPEAPIGFYSIAPLLAKLSPILTPLVLLKYDNSPTKVVKKN